MSESSAALSGGVRARKFVYRILFYVLGLLIMAFGVAISVNSELGVSTVNSLPYVISLITGSNLGTCVIIVFGCYIVVQILLLRKQFKWINLTQIIFSTIFGKLVMLAVSIVMIAVGVSMYVGTKLINMPMEGMTSAITELLPGKSFHQVKVVVDCIVVVAALVLSVVFLHGLYGVREGTILCALLVGSAMKPIQKVLLPVMNRICF